MARKPTISKESIIIASLDCFLETGFEETTFSQISKSLGVSQPYIYKFFDHKMDLLGSCSMWASEKGRDFIDSQIDQKKPARIRLHQYIEGNFQFFKNFPKEAYALSALYFFSQSHEDLYGVFKKTQQIGIERIESLVLQVSYESGGTLQEPLRLAEMIHSLIVGEIYKIIYRKKNESRKTHHAFLLKQIDLLIQTSIS